MWRWCRCEQPRARHLDSGHRCGPHRLNAGVAGGGRMSDQAVLFQTEEEQLDDERKEKVARMDAYLKALTGCPFCGKDETGPTGYVRNHFMTYTLPNFHDGAGCIRLHLLGNQTRYAARQGDGRWLDKYTEITRYREKATQWPAEWFDDLEADLAEIGVLSD